MEVICETFDILQDIEKAISEEMKEAIKIKYFESVDDPSIEKLPIFNKIDVNSFLKKITMLNDHLQSEKEEKENDYERTIEWYNKKTENIQPEDSEYYVEEVVMKELYENDKIKSKEMFR
jgi:hypothetical protein